MNRKALDQYASFTDQRTELKRRQEENSKGEDKINQLIRTLDLRKEEAIERTFKVRIASTTKPHASFELLVAHSILCRRTLSLTVETDLNLSGAP